MTDELYINGTRADMSSKSGVYLQYNSCLLSSLDSIDANHSYTIKLPKTANNLALIGGLLFPSSGSTFPSANNAATLLRDGVPLCQDATLYLMGITTDEIQVAVSWGIGDKLDAINDKSIRETSWAENEVKEWKEEDGLYMYFGVGTDKAHVDGQYRHIDVKVNEILNAINQETGEILDYDESIFADFYVPILLRKPLSSEVPEENVIFSASSLYIKDGSLSGTQSQGGAVCFVCDSYDSNYFKLNEYGEGATDTNSISVEKWVKIRIKLSFKTDNTFGNFSFEYRSYKNGTQTSELLPQYNAAEGKYYYSYDATFDADDEITFLRLLFQTNLYIDFYDVEWKIYLGDDEEENNTLAIPNTGDERSMLRMSENLPDISCMDFLKGICGLFGLFPCLVEDKIVLRAYENLFDSSNSTDWSSYLCSENEYPNQMDITDDTLGQNTKFSYQNDEDVPLSAGYITVSNNALEKEVDFMQVAFTACEDVGAIAYIPIYSIIDNEGQQEWEYEENEDCYVLEEGEVETQSATNKGLYFQSFGYFIGKYYLNFQQVCENRVITEYFYLDSVVLKDIDMTKPIYLSKYGRYFALMEIKTKENDMAEVKLLTL